MNWCSFSLLHLSLTYEYISKTLKIFRDLLSFHKRLKRAILIRNLLDSLFFFVFCCLFSDLLSCMIEVSVLSKSLNSLAIFLYVFSLFLSVFIYLVCSRLLQDLCCCDVQNIIMFSCLLSMPSLSKRIELGAIHVKLGLTPQLS